MLEEVYIFSLSLNNTQHFNMKSWNFAHNLSVRVCVWIVVVISLQIYLYFFLNIVGNFMYILGYMAEGFMLSRGLVTHEV